MPTPRSEAGLAAMSEKVGGLRTGAAHIETL